MSQASDPVGTTCYRHRDRFAGVSCQRCNRPICPSCMVQASVGFQCPDCTKRGAKNSPVITTRSLDVQPVVTQALIALNVLGFLAVLATGGTLQNGGGTATVDYALLAAGQFGRGAPIVGVAGGEWYRLLTGGFLHASIIQLGVNMVGLWLVGSQVERLLGRARYLALYLAVLLAGSFAAMLVQPDRLTLGASAALFGLVAADYVVGRGRGDNIMRSGLGGLIVVGLLLSLRMPGVSIAGIVGGVVGGLVVGAALFELDRRTRESWSGVALCLAFATVFAAGGILAANFYFEQLHPVINL